MSGTREIDELEARIDTLEQTGQYDEAIEVLGRLQELTGDDQRWHVAWMHVLAGRRGQADAIWAALERENLGDPTVPFLAGSAHAEAGESDVAAPIFEHALDLALRAGSDGDVLRQILTARGEALEDAGMEPGELDEAARRVLARAAAQGADTPVATPFFAEDEFEEATATFQAFAEDWAQKGWAEYAHDLDGRMRAAAAGSPRHPVVVPLTVAEVVDYGERHGIDPDAAEARARAAYELAQEGRSIAWPPGRNEPCWCGSGKKYKRCCGR